MSTFASRALFDTLPALDPPAGVTPNFVDPPTQGNILYVTSGLCLVFAAACVSMRTITRLMISKLLQIEDYASILSLV